MWATREAACFPGACASNQAEQWLITGSRTKGLTLALAVESSSTSTRGDITVATADKFFVQSEFQERNISIREVLCEAMLII